MYTSAKKIYRVIAAGLIVSAVCALSAYAFNRYTNNDFGEDFEPKSAIAIRKLAVMNGQFETCGKLAGTDAKFMQAIVFPEVMRFNFLKDGIEAESLRSLYVQFGREYANFSIGLFQMKPSFAEMVETRSALLLPDSITREFGFSYDPGEEAAIRRERVNRLCDPEWQLVYLTAFTCLCNELFKDRKFDSPTDKLQWYATVYNAGFDHSNAYIKQKVLEENFYFGKQMPGKKFRYAALASWYYIAERTTPTLPEPVLAPLNNH